MQVGNIRLIQCGRKRKLEEVGELSVKDLALISAALREIDPAKFQAEDTKRIHRLAIIFKVMQERGKGEACRR